MNTAKTSQLDERETLSGCQRIYSTLLEFGRVQSSGTKVYLRELFETARCDHVKDLSARRDAYEDYVNTYSPGGMERILDYRDTHRDAEVAKQAVLHMFFNDRQVLYNALTFHNLMLNLFIFERPSPWRVVNEPSAPSATTPADR
ncbi:hypothetical protein CAOG_03841 [Capsaspora owczarzaki ATCC 30864]|uniref:Uncharacterized protein n=1 Tax=Capsaspora owczarzaki (strain ATCC 30864) TaxID=595528 RepID=A0A0D2WQ22_CAPO3|nr:hypothetical protein CAOG_03841 [Capsaspora owczarzaki ATCC 30864]KJE92973.1 hypothetical protein CAOG_003841 [Capsaspora owczarzaki ATCC 30864]|eukprot:XP_004363569.1 hypothetical protein CAOG_03841 [Capsaspora owczarzaki ATCC 30864]